MSEDVLTLEDLEALAKAVGLRLPAARLAALLPGVQLLRAQAAGLRALPVEGEEPAAEFSPP